jgi:hypothetical protein
VATETGSEIENTMTIVFEAEVVDEKSNSSLYMTDVPADLTSRAISDLVVPEAESSLSMAGSESEKEDSCLKITNEPVH